MNANATSKSIGNVNIFELSGSFKGPLASRCSQNIKSRIHSFSGYSILFHGFGVHSFDHIGAQVLLESAKLAPKSVLLTRDPFMAHELYNVNPEHKIAVFDKETDAVMFLGKELTAPDKREERRVDPRLSVAVPVQVSPFRLKGTKNPFLGVATNMSINGMFLTPLHAQAEYEIKKNSWSYENETLQFGIQIPKGKMILVNGKVIRLNLTDIGLGIKFVDFLGDSKERLKEFLAQQDNSAVS